MQLPRPSTALLLAVLTLALSAPSTWAAEELPQFDISCEFDGKHGDDPDRVDPELELRLVRESLEAAYPHLTREEQWYARTFPTVINHSKPGLTKNFGGWGPEDDPEYVAGQPDTIKVTVSERTVQSLAFRDKFPAPGTRSGDKPPGYGFWAHEILHEIQWICDDVRDLKSLPPDEACPDGLCNRDLLAENVRKVTYEIEATLYGISFSHPDDAMRGAKHLDAMGKKHPKWFEAGGRFSLLDPKTALERAASMIEMQKAGGLSGRAKLFYHGQHRLPQLVWDLVELNDRLAAGEIERGMYETDLATITEEATTFVDAGKVTERLLAGFKFLVPVRDRYLREIERSKGLLAR